MQMLAAHLFALEEPHLRAGDATAGDRFTDLVNRQARFVFRVAYSRLRNRHDAEDLVQETFFKLYRTRAWERMEDERAFLARTVWRLASERLGKHGSKPVEAPAMPPASSPEETAIALDWEAAVHRLIDALPEDLRQPLVLSSLDELSSRQIGEVLGISEGTVRTRLLRARRLLKEKLTNLMEGRYAR